MCDGPKIKHSVETEERIQILLRNLKGKVYFGEINIDRKMDLKEWCLRARTGFICRKSVNERGS
jgi:hypothetical protein